MVESTSTATPDAELSDFIARQHPPLMAGAQWSALQTLDVIRLKFDGFFAGLNDEERFDYVRLQRVWIDAQHSMERAVRQLTETFRQHAVEQLTTELKALTGQAIDPVTANIHTRYLHTPRGERGESYAGEDIRVASVSLLDAACINYDGLTGWSYPGHTGLADASYLDDGIKATASQFIALVRRLDIGSQLKRQLDDALKANGALGAATLALASAEFEFALIEALNNAATSRVDRAKYQQVKRALVGEQRWDVVEQMQLFIPDGVDTISWLPQPMGFTGQYAGPPPGDSLSIPHIVFSVSGCQGAFSFFPNRPGGSLRHHDSHREACEEFYVAFQGFYNSGQIDWLHQVMVLRDCLRLKQMTKLAPEPPNLNVFARLLFAMANASPRLEKIRKLGYVRNTLRQTPVVSLNGFYIKRCRGNLEELANHTPGFMPTLIELFKTLVSEIVNILLIPVPGAVKGLGRVRAFSLFATLSHALVEGGHQVLQGDSSELLQAFADLADLLVSSRLHTRLARTVLHRHQRLYQSLAQPLGRDHQSLSEPQWVERMLAAPDTPTRATQALLAVSGTSRETLHQVWTGAAPPAALVEAAQRLNTDRLIDWVATGADPTRSMPADGFTAMAPLLTQLESWPVDTALSLQSPQGLELCRYSKDPAQPATVTVSVTALENDQFAYGTSRRLTAHLPSAIEALIPGLVSSGEATLREHLAAQAQALRIDLFEALTQFAEVTRSAATHARASVRALLPDSLGGEQPVPAVVAALQALHPQLSLARLLEGLREHPLSEHQRTQLLVSQLQPEALYDALRAARRASRREAMVDGLFHARRFDRQTQAWAAAFADAALRERTGHALLVSSAGQPVPFVAGSEAARTVVVIDHRQGQFAPFNLRDAREGSRLTGAESFYEAVVNSLPENDLHRLGPTVHLAINALRDHVATTLLRNRAPDGSFYPYRREIGQYAHTDKATGISGAPDRLGLHALGEERYLFLEGEYFKVSQASPTQPWRIQHPTLHAAYAPALVHNGAGAWRHEWENPLTWDGQRPFYRLGPAVRWLTPDAIEQVQRISGVTSDMLRRTHVRNERPPAILLDTLERFAAHQRVMDGTQAGAQFFAQLLGEIAPERADALVGSQGVEREDQVSVLETKVALDKPLMQHLFFEALCPVQQRSADPLAQVLQRDHHGLTTAVAEDLARSSTPAERQSLERGVVPLTLTPAIRWWLEYLRKTRVLESAHLPATANEDSPGALLQALAQIDGWPAHLRVEVWRDGFLSSSVGPFDGSLKCLVTAVSSQYQAHTLAANGRQAPVAAPGPFLEVLLAALPAAERQSLGYIQGTGEDELLEQVRSRLQRKWEFLGTQESIGRRPRFHPPRRVADGRIAYPLSGSGLKPAEREQVARLRVLYPSKTDAEVLQLWNDAGDSVRERDALIDYLYRERDAMNAALGQWRDATPAGPRRDARALAVVRIQRCWAREASAHGTAMIKELNLDGLDLTDLPALGAYFGHVEVLSLKNNQLSQLPTRLLRCFPSVRRLYLCHNQFAQLPVGLNAMPYLSALYLGDNRLKFTLGDVIYLGELTPLRVLDLSSNPLRQGQRLDLSRLKHLRYLNLRNTQLESLPRGAVTLPMLEVFDLQDNRIKVLTRSDLFLFTDVHRAMDLRDNPLSEGTLQMFRQYREVPGRENVYFGLHPDGAATAANPDRWLAVLAVRDVPSHLRLWHELQAREIFGRFFTLLERISAYPTFIATGYRALREELARRVWRLIERAANDDQLATLMYEHRYEMTGGADGWMVSLNDLQLKFLIVELHASEGDDGAALLNAFRARSRLAAITNAVLVADPGQPSGLAGTRILAYRIALGRALDLPLGFDQRLDRTLGTPSPESVAQMRNRVIAAEALLDWPALLVQEDYWVAFLKGKYQARFQAALGHYDQSLQTALDSAESETLNENAYLVLANRLLAQRKGDEDRLVLELSQLEWGRFAGA